MLADNVYLVKKGTKHKTVGASEMNITVSCIPVFAGSRLLENFIMQKANSFIMVILM